MEKQSNQKIRSHILLHNSCKEMVQLNEKIEQDWAHLFQQHEKSLQFAQACSNVALFEQLHNTFSSHAMTHQENMMKYVQEINQFERLQNLTTMFKDQCEPLIKKVQEQLQLCSIFIFTTKLNALKVEIEHFLSQTLSGVGKTVEEIEQLKIQHKFEVSLKDFEIKVQECERAIEQKANMLKNLRNCFSTVQTKYLLVMNILPNQDQDFLDIEKLESKVNPIKAESENGFLCK